MTLIIQNPKIQLFFKLYGMIYVIGYELCSAYFADK